MVRLHCQSCNQCCVQGYKEKRPQVKTTDCLPINVVYYDEIHITHIDDWRICPARREDTCDGPPQYLPEQKQCQTHYGSCPWVACTLCVQTSSSVLCTLVLVLASPFLDIEVFTYFAFHFAMIYPLNVTRKSAKLAAIRRWSSFRDWYPFG